MGSSSRALSVPPESLESLPAWPSPGASLGLPSLIATSTCRVHVRGRSKSRFVPSATFPTSSTAYSSAGLAGLFHPAATSRVCSSGSSPREKPYELVARRLPSCRLRWSPALGLTHWLQETAPAFRAFLRSRIRRRRWWFRPSKAPYPPELSLPRVLLRAPTEWPSPFCPTWPFAALVVYPAYDLPCSCEPDSPVQGSWPETAMATCAVIGFEALLPGDRKSVV